MEPTSAATKIQVPQNTKRITLSEAWEVNYWTTKFKCTEEELRKAINAVGNSAVCIDDFLGSY